MNNHRFLLFRFPVFLKGLLLVLGLFICSVSGVRAQEIKKSTRIEKIDGKKYYIHTVEQGQTLYAIAKVYSLEVNDIVLDNPDAIDGIKPGQELKILLSKSVRNSYSTSTTDGKTKTHKVESGQTLYSISRQYNVTVESIKAINPELKDGLKAGMVIKLPDNAKEQKAVTDTDTPIKENKENTSEKENHGVTELSVKKDTTFSLRKKEVYNVALFAPFHLENVDNIDVDKIAHDIGQIPGKTEQAIQFYQGFRLAMDSLKKAGLKVQLYVYDIDDGDSLRVQQILHKTEFTSMQLIVGPLTGGCFTWVSKFAHDKNIPIVAPLSQQNKILLNNECVSKLIPSMTTQLEEQAAFIAKHYKEENVILITNSNPKETQYTTAFRNAYSELQRNGLVKDSLRQLKGVEGLSKSISSSKINVVIVPSGGQAYVTDVLRMLNTLAEKNTIIVFGMQSWRNFASLDYDYLNKLQLHYTTNSFVDYEDDVTADFVKKYRLSFDEEPAQASFQGYDAGFYYLNALRLYGVEFGKKLPSMKWSGIQSAFDLYKTSPESGFENKAVNMVMIQDYKLIKAN
jgi:LysM repeat protein/ABC-type branched-subunit amino acid transport system substrate-binding protein